MAISFPQNPTIGDTYVVGQNTFVFDGALWTLGATAGTTFNVQLNTSITDTAPSNPNPGDIWLNATTGQGLVYFDDGDTQQWVDIGQPGPPGGPGYTGSAGTTGFTGSQGQGANVYDNDTNATGFFDLPVGTTEQRPGSPTDGYTRVNSTTNYLEIYYDGQWTGVRYIGAVQAFGGQIGFFGAYKVHTFTSSGVFEVQSIPDTGVTLEYLIVGGGGSGGDDIAGGGGGGDVKTGTISASVGSFNIEIGAGGVSTTGTEGTGRGNDGQPTTAFSLTASGGGAGGGEGQTAGNPGANGGGAGYSAATGGTGNPGYNGGNSTSGICGGGGGAGGAGQNGNTVSGQGGDGGPGVLNAIDGNNFYYGAGGGGSGWTNATQGGDGGLGGGGGSGGVNNDYRNPGLGDTNGRNHGQNGNIGGNGKGGNAGANTGSGGGGSGETNAGYQSTSGQGGSGIVIIRYQIQG